MNKKFMYLRTVTLLIFMIMGIFSFLKAEVYPEFIKHNWPPEFNPMGEWNTESCVQILDEHLLQVEVCITVTDNNLDLYPGLYLHYNFGDLIIGENLISNVNLITDKNRVSLYPTFEKCFNYIFDVSSYCPGISLGDPSGQASDGTNAVIDFPFELKLMELNVEGNYVDYPVDEYNGSNGSRELFFEEVFNDIYEPIDDYKVLCCPGNHSSHNFVGNEENNNLKELNEIGIKQKSMNFSNDLFMSEVIFDISPNPCDEFAILELRGILIENPVEIIINEVTGKEVFKNSYQLLQPKQSILIPMQNFKKGLYFFTVIQNEHFLTKKIVKQ